MRREDRDRPPRSTNPRNRSGTVLDRRDCRMAILGMQRITTSWHSARRLRQSAPRSARHHGHPSPIMRQIRGSRHRVGVVMHVGDHRPRVEVVPESTAVQIDPDTGHQHRRIPAGPLEHQQSTRRPHDTEPDEQRGAPPWDPILHTDTDTAGTETGCRDIHLQGR